MTILLIFSLAIPVQALDLQAPEVPESGKAFMPNDTESFSDGLWHIVKEGVQYIRPSIADCAKICLSAIVSVILCSVVKTIPGASAQATELVGTLLIGLLIMKPSNSMIHLGADTIQQISSYGKLLFPVLTAALAAGGGVSTSAALYTIAIAIDSVLSSVISSIIVPAVYTFLCLAIASAAIANHYLDKIKGFIKWSITGGVKLVLYVFSAFMSITGVISGTTDASALKATKLTISGLVPVVGGILADASETVLVSSALVRNAVGIYGLLAVLSIWIGPFIKIGTQYLMLKITWSFCDVFATKQTCKLIGDFSTAMGLILAMTGTVCILLLISIVCFMKGVSG